LYETPVEITDINDVRNGILLRNDLHSAYADGDIAFLKTPNFALDCGDVPRVETGDMPSDRITLQHLVLSNSLSPVLGFDAVMTGDNTKKSLPPPDVTLDYMYGAAAYKRWGAGEIHETIEQYQRAHYKDIPLIERDDRDDDGDDDGGSGSEDPSGNYVDSKLSRKNTVRRGHKEMSDGMLEAMDNIRYLSMMVHGITPHDIAVRRRKQEEEAESRAREASRIKVQRWITG